MRLFKMKSINCYNDELLKKSIKTNLILLLIGTIYLIWYRLTHIGIPCLFHLVTGLYCPGCGISRMFLAIIRLNFSHAFKSNCFVFILLPYGIFAYIRHYVFMIRGKVYRRKEFNRYVLIGIIIAALAFGVIRNIPQFYFLRPQA